MKNKKKTVYAADLFAGAGGTSSGLRNACKFLGLKLELLAINHWDVAIATHSLNHPKARHLCESLENVDPRKAVPGGRLNLLLASPECIHHSRARGGKPMQDQSRTSGWVILRWAELLYIETIIIENVKEYRDWGPLGANNKPLKSKLGETYRAFINSLRSLGYTVEDRILNAADYGDPTTRERLFIVARRGNKKISWPERTHTPTGAPDLFKKTKKWKSARSIIDWTVPGESIFTRKRPLAPATLARIEAGLRKFGGTAAEPFLVILRNHGGARSLDEPIPTLTAGGNHVGVCEPFVLGQQSCASPRSTKKPLPTIATKGTIALVEPFIVPFFGERNGQKPRTHSLQDPLPTVTSHGAGALVEPFLLTVNHGDEGEKSRARRVHSMEEPVPTMTTKNGLAMIEPFLMNIDHTGGNGVPVRSVDKPVSTQTTKARTALVEPLIVQYQGKSKAHPVDAPLNTITSGNHFGLVEPFLIKYNGTAKARPVDVPLDTVTTKDRFGLIETEHGQVRVDIRFRMLRPDELARAMSFDENYKFTGTKALQVRQIGNAVAVKTAEALCMAALA